MLFPLFWKIAAVHVSSRTPEFQKNCLLFMPRLDPRGGRYSLIWPMRGCAAGQGMVFTFLFYFCSPWRRFVLQTEISGNFLFHTFFCFTYFVFCVFVSLTAVRISRSVYFFTSNVLLIQVYLRSGNSQRLVAVVFPVYKLCMVFGLSVLNRVCDFVRLCPKQGI